MCCPLSNVRGIEFCTVAHWKNGEIIEEKLFYDFVGLLKQTPITVHKPTSPDRYFSTGKHYGRNFSDSF